MTEGWVVFAFVSVYGFMLGYAGHLLRRTRRLKRRIDH